MVSVNSGDNGGHIIVGMAQKFHRYEDGEVVETSEHTRGSMRQGLEENRKTVGAKSYSAESVEARDNGEMMIVAITSTDGIFSKGFEKNVNNVVHTMSNDTSAAQLANSLVDGKDKDGNPTISAKAFYAACAEHYPNVKPGNISNCITVYDATGSFTNYAVRQATYDKAQQRQEMEAQGERPSLELQKQEE